MVVLGMMRKTRLVRKRFRLPPFDASQDELDELVEGMVNRFGTIMVAKAITQEDLALRGMLVEGILCKCSDLLSRKAGEE